MRSALALGVRPTFVPVKWTSGERAKVRAAHRRCVACGSKGGGDDMSKAAIDIHRELWPDYESLLLECCRKEAALIRAQESLASMLTREAVRKAIEENTYESDDGDYVAPLDLLHDLEIEPWDLGPLDGDDPDHDEASDA